MGECARCHTLKLSIFESFTCGFCKDVFCKRCIHSMESKYTLFHGFLCEKCCYV